jgi:hypothetical protein
MGTILKIKISLILFAIGSSESKKLTIPSIVNELGVSAGC